MRGSATCDFVQRVKVRLLCSEWEWEYNTSESEITIKIIILTKKEGKWVRNVWEIGVEGGCCMREPEKLHEWIRSFDTEIKIQNGGRDMIN